MKVALINLYSGVNSRGAENFSHNLAGHLAKDFAFTIVSAGRVDVPGVANRIVYVPPIQPQQGLSGRWLTDLRKRLFLDPANLAVLWFSLRSFSYLWRERFDVLIPVNGFWQLLICKLVALFRGGKILVVGHSGPFWDERWNLYLKPDVFVATTGPTGEWARKVCFWTRVVVIPYGIEAAKYASAKPADLSLPGPVVLCPAAAVAYKRVDLAILAVAKTTHLSLLYLGSGPLELELVTLGRKTLGARFCNLSVAQEEMPGYFAACDVVTLPSSSQENSPIVFQEALAAGKPVVATDTPRNRWILGEAGIFVDPQNPEVYAKSLTGAVRGANKAALRKRALEFDWKNIADEYKKLLVNLK